MENKHETIACFVCEQTTEPQKVKYTHVKGDGINYLKFSARLQTYGVWNRNKRNYFLEPMKKSWAAPHIKELIQRGDFWGEYGHPITDNPKRIVTIDQKYCSHRFTNIYFKGNSVYGDVETLNDDSYGKQFTMRTLQGCDPAFSLRAMVPLTKIDAVRAEIREPGHIITVDSVILPSHDDAYIVEGSNTIESTLPRNGGKDICIPVTESSNWIDYLQEESFNLKTVIDHYDMNVSSINFDTNAGLITVRENTNTPGLKRTAIVKADNFIRDEVSYMLSKI